MRTTWPVRFRLCAEHLGNAPTNTISSSRFPVRDIDSSRRCRTCRMSDATGVAHRSLDTARASPSPSTLLGTGRDVNGHGPERRFDVIDGRGDGRGPAERLSDPSIPARQPGQRRCRVVNQADRAVDVPRDIRRGERAPRNGRRGAALAPESDSAASTNPAAHYLCRGGSAPRRGVGARWSVGGICQRPRGQC